MNDAASLERMALEQDQRISEVVRREQSRLRNFIRRRVPDPRDAEDILQDVFYELVEATRLLMPIEHVTGWLFRVARNRITDLFRKKKPESIQRRRNVADEDGRAAASGRPAAFARRRTGGALCAQRDARRTGAGARGVAGRAARSVYGARAGRAQLQGNGGGNRSEREYACCRASAMRCCICGERLQAIYDEFMET